MCCVFTVLLFLGPRVANITWWLIQPARWSVAFGSVIWPILGIIFLPWTTLMYVAVNNPVSGVSLLGWIFVALGVFADLNDRAMYLCAPDVRVPVSGGGQGLAVRRQRAASLAEEAERCP